jgi:hypothetical protein
VGTAGAFLVDVDVRVEELGDNARRVLQDVKPVALNAQLRRNNDAHVADPVTRGRVLKNVDVDKLAGLNGASQLRHLPHLVNVERRKLLSDLWQL